MSERSFNITSTASRLIFAHSHLPPPPTTFALSFSASDLDCRPPPCEPLPSAEGCGLHRHCHSSLRSEGAAVNAAAPPLSKWMWVVYARSTVHPTPPTTIKQRHQGVTDIGHRIDDDDDDDEPPPPRPKADESSPNNQRPWMPTITTKSNNDPQRRRRRTTTTTTTSTQRRRIEPPNDSGESTTKEAETMRRTPPGGEPGDNECTAAAS